MSRAAHDKRDTTPPTQEMDARGLSSPLPVLRADRALRAMQVGESLRVITSHHHTLAEFQSLVKHVPGYELMSQEQDGDAFVHLLVRRR